MLTAQFIFALSVIIVRAAFMDSTDVSPIVLVLLRAMLSLGAFAVIHHIRMYRRRKQGDIAVVLQLPQKGITGPTPPPPGVGASEERGEGSQQPDGAVSQLRPPHRDEFNDLPGSMRLRCYALGICGVTINMLGSASGVKYTDAITAGAIQCAIPPMSFVIAFFFAGESMTAVKMAALALAVTGNLIMAQVWQLGGSNVDGMYYVGCLLLLMNITAYSVLLVFQKPLVAILPKTELFYRMYISGFAGLLVVAACRYDLVIAQLLNGAVTARVWLAVCFSGLVNSTFAYYLVAVGVAGISPGAAAVYFCLQPVFVSILSTIFLGEGLTWIRGGGGVLILVGVIVSAIPQLRGHRSSPSAVVEDGAGATQGGDAAGGEGGSAPMDRVLRSISVVHEELMRCESPLHRDIVEVLFEESGPYVTPTEMATYAHPTS